MRDHLQNRHIDESLLIKILSRPLQVVHYREERWGPFAQSLPSTQGALRHGDLSASRVEQW